MEFPSTPQPGSSPTCFFSPTLCWLISLGPDAGSYPFSFYLLCQEAQVGLCLTGQSGAWNRGRSASWRSPEENSKPVASMASRAPQKYYLDNTWKTLEKMMPQTGAHIQLQISGPEHIVGCKLLDVHGLF